MTVITLTRTALLMTACTAFSAAAANLLPGDTSFETGPEEWLGGQSVVRRDAPFGHRVLELSRPYNHSKIYYGLIKAGQPYALTFSARCPAGPVTAKIAAAHVLYNFAAAPRDFKLDRAWKRFSLPFQPQKQDRDVYLTVNLPEGSRIELDGLTLAAAPGAPYASPDVPSVGIAPTGHPGNMLFDHDPAPVLETGVAAGTAALNGRLTCRTVDFNGRTCAELVRPITLKPGENVRVQYPALPRNERGYYLVRAELTGPDGKLLAAAAQPFGVIPKPLELAAEKSFFGLHPDTNRVELAALPRIGVKWLRKFYLWRQLEPRQNQINPMKDSEQEYGMSVLACIKLLEGAPGWAPRRNHRLTDFSAMERFLDALNRAAPDAVKAWEIENEPDLCYPSLLKQPFREAAEYYGILANAAGTALKKSSPRRAVAAISGSGNASGTTFIDIVMPHCKNAFDIVTVHPYTGARYIGPGLRAVAPDAYMREELKSKIKILNGKKLWAGEVGWACDTREAIDSASVRLFSDYVARALILIRSVPEVEKVMWFKAQGCYERNYYQYGIWRSEFEPLPAAVFYADIARRLDTARPYRPVFETDIRAYAFVAADGRPFVALWKYKGDTNELLIDAPPASVRLTDLFGRAVPLKQRDGGTVVPLSSTPAWLEVDGTDPDALVKLLAATKINLAPATVNVYYRRDGRISGSLRNNLPQAQTVTLAADAPGVAPQQFDLPPSGVRAFTFRLPQPDGPYRLQASAAAGISRYDDPGNYLRCPAATGWDHLTDGPDAIRLAERRYIYPPDPNIGWNSTADLSGRFGCGWDKKYFYFAADVTDPVHYQPSEIYRAWNGDSVQLAFDTMNDATEGVFDFNATDVEFIAWLSPKGPRLAKTFSPSGEIGKPVSGARIEIRREGNLTRYRLALPWSALAELSPLPGRIFAMNFIVNQNNGQGRRYWLGLTEGTGEMKYPWLYRRFLLTAPGDAR